MFSLAIFSSARCPAAFLTVTLQSCDRLRGVSETRKKKGARLVLQLSRQQPRAQTSMHARTAESGSGTLLLVLSDLTSSHPCPQQPRQSPVSKVRICPGSSPEFNHTISKKIIYLVSTVLLQRSALKSSHTRSSAAELRGQ